MEIKKLLEKLNFIEIDKDEIERKADELEMGCDITEYVKDAETEEIAYISVEITDQPREMYTAIIDLYEDTFKIKVNIKNVEINDSEEIKKCELAMKQLNEFIEYLKGLY